MRGDMKRLELNPAKPAASEKSSSRTAAKTPQSGRTVASGRRPTSGKDSNRSLPANTSSARTRAYEAKLRKQFKTSTEGELRRTLGDRGLENQFETRAQMVQALVEDMLLERAHRHEEEGSSGPQTHRTEDTDDILSQDGKLSQQFLPFSTIMQLKTGKGHVTGGENLAKAAAAAPSQAAKHTKKKWGVLVFKGLKEIMERDNDKLAQVLREYPELRQLKNLGKVLLGMAGKARNAKRIVDYALFMCALVDHKVRDGDSSLTTREREMLSEALKAYVGEKRAAWRALDDEGIERIPQDPRYEAFYLECARAYRATYIEREIFAICQEVCVMLEEILIPTAETVVEALEGSGNKDALQSENVSLTFFLRMCGDYYRYQAELSPKNKEELAKKTLTMYERAWETALSPDDPDKMLLPTNTVRLSVALNLAVFYFEILGNKKKAVQISKDTFELAIGKMKKVMDWEYKETTMLMNLLRDNVTLWTDSDDEESDDDYDPLAAVIYGGRPKKEEKKEEEIDPSKQWKPNIGDIQLLDIETLVMAAQD